MRTFRSKKNAHTLNLRPISIAVAAALSLPAPVMAVGLPGHGVVVRGTVNGTTAGNPIPSLGAGPAGTITVTSTRAVVHWGSPAVIDVNNDPGFNVDSGNTLNFTAAGAAAILNVDVSGNPSKILGTITDTSSNVHIYIANQNGIVVGPSAVISAPAGLGLLGVNLESIQDADDFFTGGTVNINFANGGDGVEIQDGADLSGVGNSLLIAGSKAINVNYDINFTDPTLAPAKGVPINIVGAVNGTASVSGTTFTATTASSSSGPVSVELNLGKGTSFNPATGIAGTPFTHPSDISIWAHGDVTNSGAIQGYFNRNDWDGTFFNNGIIADPNGLTITGSKLNFATSNATGTPPSPPALRGSLDNSGTLGATGSFISITGVQDVINSGNILAGGTASSPAATSAFVLISNVASVDNSGTIQGGVASAATLASASVRISSVTGDVTNSGTIQGGVANASDAADASVRITGVGGNVTNSGSIQGGVAGGTGSNSPDGWVSVIIQANGNITNSGTIQGGTATANGTGNGTTATASAQVSLSAGGNITNSGTIQGGTATATGTGTSASAIALAQVSLSAGGNIDNSGTIQGGTATATGTGTGASATALAQVNLTAGGSVTNSKQIQAGSATATAPGGTTTNEDVTITASGPVSNATGASIIAGDDVIVSATGTATANITNSGLIHAGDDVTLAANGNITNSGSISGGSSGNVSITSGGAVSNSGSIKAGTAPVDDVFIAAGGPVSNTTGASINAGGDVTVLTPGAVSNGGSIAAGDDVTVYGGTNTTGPFTTRLGAASFNNSGTVQAGTGPTADVSILAQSFTNTGSIQAGGFVLGAGATRTPPAATPAIFFGAGDFTNSGSITAGSNSNMAFFYQNIDNQANLTAGGHINLRAVTDVTNGGGVDAGGNLTIGDGGGIVPLATAPGGTEGIGGDLENTGTLSAGGNVLAVVNGNLDNATNAVISASNHATLLVDGNVINDGTIDAHQNMTIAGSNPIQGLSLTLGGSIFSTTVGSGAQSVTNSGTLMAGGTMSISSLNGMQNEGSVDPNTFAYTGGDLTGFGTIEADTVNLTLTGDVHDWTGSGASPNFLENSLEIQPHTGDTVALTINAVRPIGPQFINIDVVNGSVAVNSGMTSSSGTFLFGAYQPPPNGQSSLIVQADGDITIQRSGVAGRGVSGFNDNFHFPGGVVFLSHGADGVPRSGDEGAINIDAPVDNAWTSAGIPFQGQFYEGGAINVSHGGNGVLFYTNFNNWINFGNPVDSDGDFFVDPVSPGSTNPFPVVVDDGVSLENLTFVGELAGFTFVPVADPSVPHANSYSEIIDVAVNGGPWFLPRPDGGPIYNLPVPDVVDAFPNDPNQH